MTVRCFWLEPTDAARVYLRRYSPSSRCSGRPTGIHDTSVLLATEAPSEGVSEIVGVNDDRRYDAMWPKQCACGYGYVDDDQWQVFRRRVFRRTDTGEEMTLDEAPPGAMWDADWMPTKGPDGRCLIVKCPDGFEWMIDGPAKNCTLPGDREHRCWLRTGEPPNVTVSKQAAGQRSCRAGGGSIGTPGYHGFLRGGVFT